MSKLKEFIDGLIIDVNQASNYLIQGNIVKASWLLGRLSSDLQGRSNDLCDGEYCNDHDDEFDDEIKEEIRKVTEALMKLSKGCCNGQKD